MQSIGGGLRLTAGRLYFLSPAKTGFGFYRTYIQYEDSYYILCKNK